MVLSLKRKAHMRGNHELEYQVEIDVLKNTQQYLMSRLVSCRQGLYSLTGRHSTQVSTSCPDWSCRQGLYSLTGKRSFTKVQIPQAEPCRGEHFPSVSCGLFLARCVQGWTELLNKTVLIPNPIRVKILAGNSSVRVRPAAGRPADQPGDRITTRQLFRAGISQSGLSSSEQPEVWPPTWKSRVWSLRWQEQRVEACAQATGKRVQDGGDSLGSHWPRHHNHLNHNHSDNPEAHHHHHHHNW